MTHDRVPVTLTPENSLLESGGRDPQLVVDLLQEVRSFHLLACVRSTDKSQILDDHSLWNTTQSSADEEAIISRPRNRLIRRLISLSLRSGKRPASLFLKDISRDNVGTNPSAGIYYGNYKGKYVVLKRPRNYIVPEVNAQARKEEVSLRKRQAL